MLTIDNMIMCTERDEKHYHEMIVHPALQLHRNAKSVLIIGGGDGGTAREVLKYNNLEEVVMVEIDSVVIEAAKEFLPSISGSLNDPRLKLIVGDGIEFVAKSFAETFDLIIVDGSDPEGPAKGLFSYDFWRNCQRCLKKDGIVVTQGESPMFHREAFVELNQCLKNIFGMNQVFTSLFYATTYPSGMWSLQLASKEKIHPTKDLDLARVKKFVHEQKLHYYNEGIHFGAFQLPTFVSKLINEI